MNFKLNNRGASKLVVTLLIILVLALGVLGGLYLKIQSDIKDKPGTSATEKEENDKDKEPTATTEPTAEAKPTDEASPTDTPSPEKDETFTLMVYLVGADLETNHGFASKQIQEILAAKSNKNLNIVLQTGGAKKWHLNGIEDGKVQRFAVENGKLVEKKNLGKTNMASQDTLTDFVKWAKEEYPADRYGICFNDHGGTATNGYGVDQIFGGTLLLNNFAEAFKAADIHFDFVAFDACTMSTFETAYILSKYADYLVASESVIYSYHGLEYTGFINMLAKDTSTNTLDLCKQMCDDLEKANKKLQKTYSEATYTIAVTDLSKMPALYKSVCAFMKELDGYIVDGVHATNVANLRYHAKYYGSPDNDFIDMADFITSCKIKTGDKAIKSLEAAVVYCKSDIAKCSGMGMYMPYNNLYALNVVIDTVFPYLTNEGYQKCLYDFANLVAYCRENNNAYYWYDESVGKACLEYVKPVTDSEYLEVALNDKGVYEWPFTLETGYKLASVEDKFYVYSNDEIYYMGSRDSTAQTGDRILLEFSGDWYALNNKIVPVIYQGRDQKIDGTNYTYSIIPATITRGSETAQVDLVAYFNYGEQDGKIIGYKYRNTTFDLMQQMTLQLEEGDKIGISYLTANNEGDITKEIKNVVVFTYEGGELPLNNMKVVADQKYAFQKSVHDYFGREYHTRYFKSSTE